MSASRKNKRSENDPLLNEKKMPPPAPPRGFFFIIMILGLISLMTYFFYANVMKKVETITFGQMMEQAKTGKIKTIEIYGYQASGAYHSGGSYNSFKVAVIPEGYLRDKATLDELDGLQKQGFIKLAYKEPNTFLYQLLLSILPLVIIFGLIWYVFFRQFKSVNNQTGIFSFGKSKSRLPPKDRPRVGPCSHHKTSISCQTIVYQNNRGD
ncbi:MAG: ATP-dependent metallopeptidase FtsH/Yme1/Tma family protein [Planctomycetota bacterium]